MDFLLHFFFHFFFLLSRVVLLSTSFFSFLHQWLQFFLHGLFSRHFVIYYTLYNKIPKQYHFIFFFIIPNIIHLFLLRYYYAQ